MRINIVTLIIVFVIAALVGYGFYIANGAETDVPLVNTLGGGFAVFVTLAGTFAVRSKYGKGSTVNLRVASGVFFLAVLIEQIIFCFLPFMIAPYIIITGLLLMVYVLIAYGIVKSIQ